MTRKDQAWAEATRLHRLNPTSHLLKCEEWHGDAYVYELGWPTLVIPTDSPDEPLILDWIPNEDLPTDYETVTTDTRSMEVYVGPPLNIDR